MRTGLTRRAALAAIAAASFAGLAAAGTAAAAASNGPTAATTTASATSDAKEFTACMRTHGLPGFKGVTVLDDGRLILNGEVNVFSEEYRKAAKACAHLLPKGTELPTAPKPPNVTVSSDPLGGDLRLPKPTPPALPG